MSRQDQSVNGDGKAYQAKGDITVYEGWSTSEVGDLLVKLASQMMTLTQGARHTADERLEEFKDALLEGLAKPENKANTQAFADPDYQYAVHTAQKAFVRDGSEKLRNELVGLLVQRSKFSAQDRLAKILNQALETVGNLGHSEHAALAIGFIFLNVQVGGLNQSDFFTKFSSFISPFVDDLTDNSSCYEYLEAQRCISLNGVITRDLTSMLHSEYGSFLGTGFDASELLAIPSPNGKTAWSGLIGATGNASKPYFFRSPDSQTLTKELVNRGFSPDAISAATNLYHSTLAQPNAVLERFDAEITGFERIKNLWGSSPLQQMTLTAVGKVIGHSAQTAKADFDGALNIWVS